MELYRPGCHSHQGRVPDRLSAVHLLARGRGRPGSEGGGAGPDWRLGAEYRRAGIGLCLAGDSAHYTWKLGCFVTPQDRYHLFHSIHFSPQ